MKFKIFLLIIISSFSLNILAQDLPKQALKSFEEGRADLMTDYMSQEISLTIMNYNERMIKEEAITRINNFFNEVQVSKFQEKHSSIRNTTAYVIGSLETLKGRYRVNCFFRKESGNFLIHQIRIDKTNE